MAEASLIDLSPPPPTIGTYPVAATRKIKVLLLLWSLQGGGAERTALHLLKGLNRNRFDVKMGLIRQSGAYLTEVSSEDLILGKMSGDRFNVEEGSNREIFTLKNILKLATLAPFQTCSILRQFKPDIALSFCKGMNIAAYMGGLLYGRKKFYWIAREGNNLNTVIENEVDHPLAQKALRQITMKAYRSADCFLTISKEQEVSISKLSKFRQDSQFTIPNGVDIQWIEKNSMEKDSLIDKPFILSVGRLDEQKGFDILLKAYSLSKLKETNDLVIVGVGPEEKNLKQQAQDLGLAEKIHFVGWKQNPWTWMKQAKAFVLSSRWEGFGNVVIEAMACGTPTIVTDCAFGPREIVQDGISGLIAKTNDPHSLSRSMDQVISHPEVRLRLSQGAKKRAEDFSAQHIVSQYENLFQSRAQRFL